MNSRKQVATIAKSALEQKKTQTDKTRKSTVYHSHYLPTPSDCELLERADVVYEKVHQSKFVTETDQNEQSGRMESHAVRLLSEVFAQLQRTENIKKL